MTYRENDPNGWRIVHFIESTKRQRTAPADVVARFVLAFCAAFVPLSILAHGQGWL